MVAIYFFAYFDIIAIKFYNIRDSSFMMFNIDVNSNIAVFNGWAIIFLICKFKVSLLNKIVMLKYFRF